MIAELETIKAEKLARPELLSLVKKYKAGDLVARNTIVEANIGLVYSIAKGFKQIDFYDAVGEGVLGLMHSIDTFDESFDTEFSTHATYWIKQKIRRSCENTGKTVRISCNTQNQIRYLKRAEQELMQTYGVPPAIDEVASHLKWTISKALDIKRLTLSGHMIEIDSPTFKGFNVNADKDEDVDMEEEKRRLGDEIAALNERQRFIITARFFEKKTLEDIGLVMRITKERVRQIEEEALTILKRRFGQIVLHKKNGPNKLKAMEEDKQEIVKQIVKRTGAPLGTRQVDESLEKEIKEARKQGATFEQLEVTYNLKQNNGMTAWRIVNRKRSV